MNNPKRTYLVCLAVAIMVSMSVFAAKQTISLGTAPDGTGGDNARQAFTKVNSNFTELYDFVDQAVKTTSSPTFAGVTTPTLTLSGTGTINGLDAIDATTEATLEAALELQ